MPKKPNESLVEYRNRVVDAKSPSFCAAKWLNATIWLGSGSTASCHHPPAHNIPLEEWDQIKRFCDYLVTASSNLEKRKDFVKFINEYDRRRSTNFTTTFPEYTEFLKEWNA